MMLSIKPLKSLSSVSMRVRQSLLFSVQIFFFFVFFALKKLGNVEQNILAFFVPAEDSFWTNSETLTLVYVFVRHLASSGHLGGSHKHRKNAVRFSS